MLFSNPNTAQAWAKNLVVWLEASEFSMYSGRTLMPIMCYVNSTCAHMLWIPVGIWQSLPRLWCCRLLSGTYSRKVCMTTCCKRTAAAASTFLAYDRRNSYCPILTDGPRMMSGFRSDAASSSSISSHASSRSSAVVYDSLRGLADLEAVDILFTSQSAKYIIPDLWCKPGHQDSSNGWIPPSNILWFA